MSETYRYTLTREIPEFVDWLDKRTVVFVMLNPSTADETTDDPTIRRCIGFARSLGFARLLVVNLFAARTTDPRALRDMDDPIGPENDRVLREATDSAGLVIAAWGVHGALHGRAASVLRNLPHVAWHSLGVTKHGHPRHPLYLLKSSQPVAFVAPQGGAT